MEEFDAERYLDSALEGPPAKDAEKETGGGRESRHGDGSDVRRKSRRSGSRENRQAILPHIFMPTA
jgi:hypothetical protein